MGRGVCSGSCSPFINRLGRNQQWDESSIGSFGESITYDPDLTLTRAMVDDVRPFLVQAKNKWSWTGNVGGASFLVYDHGTGISRPDHELGRLKTNYLYTGPNLTDVTRQGSAEMERFQHGFLLNSLALMT